MIPLESCRMFLECGLVRDEIAEIYVEIWYPLESCMRRAVWYQIQRSGHVDSIADEGHLQENYYGRRYNYAMPLQMAGMLKYEAQNCHEKQVYPGPCLYETANA